VTERVRDSVAAGANRRVEIRHVPLQRGHRRTEELAIFLFVDPAGTTTVLSGGRHQPQHLQLTSGQAIGGRGACGRCRRRLTQNGRGPGATRPPREIADPSLETETLHIAIRRAHTADVITDYAPSEIDQPVGNLPAAGPPNPVRAQLAEDVRREHHERTTAEAHERDPDAVAGRGVLDRWGDHRRAKSLESSTPILAQDAACANIWRPAAHHARINRSSALHVVKSGAALAGVIDTATQ